jgi:hypothetical protein
MHVYGAAGGVTPQALPSVSADDLVYFMHVPRTAGRTLNSCFYSASTPPSRKCPKSYDDLKRLGATCT